MTEVAWENLPRVLSAETARDKGSMAELARATGRAVPFSFGRAFSDAADQHHMTEAHCLLYLHKRVASAEAALRRDASWPGRVFNQLTGAAWAYVPMSRHVLRTVLRACDDPEMPEAVGGGHLLLRLDLARELLTRFHARMRDKGLAS